MAFRNAQQQAVAGEAEDYEEVDYEDDEEYDEEDEEGLDEEDEEDDEEFDGQIEEGPLHSCASYVRFFVHVGQPKPACLDYKLHATAAVPVEEDSEDEPGQFVPGRSQGLSAGACMSQKMLGFLSCCLSKPLTSVLDNRCHCTSDQTLGRHSESAGMPAIEIQATVSISSHVLNLSIFELHNCRNQLNAHSMSFFSS